MDPFGFDDFAREAWASSRNRRRSASHSYTSTASAARAPAACPAMTFSHLGGSPGCRQVLCDILEQPSCGRPPAPPSAAGPARARAGAPARGPGRPPPQRPSRGRPCPRRPHAGGRMEILSSRRLARDLERDGERRGGVADDGAHRGVHALELAAAGVGTPASWCGQPPQSARAERGKRRPGWSAARVAVPGSMMTSSPSSTSPSDPPAAPRGRACGTRAPAPPPQVPPRRRGHARAPGGPSPPPTPPRPASRAPPPCGEAAGGSTRSKRARGRR